MPNHVTNELSIEGEGAKKVMDILFNEDESITFDNFAPMPEELRGTSSPTRVVSQEEYGEAVIKRNEEIAKGDNFIMGLPLTVEIQAELISKYGTDNWYDWACKNWSTKWGAYDGYRHCEDVCSFNSAWSTPYNAMVELSRQNPNVTLTIKYADEDFGYNVGEYVLVGGILIGEKAPEGGSKEAILMAMDITGDEYYLYDYINECYDEEEFESEKDSNEFIKTILGIIVDKKVIPNGKFIIPHLKELALADEEFEYIIELDEALKEKA